MDEPTDQGDPSPRAPLPDAWWGLSVRTRRLIAAATVVAVVVVGFLVVRLLRDDGPLDAAVFVARLPSDRVELWDDLAQCESQSQWHLDSGNGFYGGLQFTLESWDGVGGTGSPADASRDEQIMRAESLYDLQGWEAWPRCSAQLGLE